MVRPLVLPPAPCTLLPMLSPTDILGPGGRIAADCPNYEHREQQVSMAEAVDRAIQGPHHLVVEAGTGVGKSFAYLVRPFWRPRGNRNRKTRRRDALWWPPIRSASKSS